MNFREANKVSAVFIILCALGLYMSDLSPSFVAEEVITRFIRDGIMVLALIIPLNAGMGLNFAVTLGAMAAQAGIILAIDFGFTGLAGLGIITAVGLTISMIAGWIVGLVLNRIRGKEMIVTMIIGFLATGVYQLVFMAGYGTVITPHNKDMMLSRGIGIRNMIDLEPFRNIMDNIWMINVAGVDIPVFMILIVLFAAGFTAYIMKTRFGMKLMAAGSDMEKAEMLGIDSDRVRIRAMMLSMVMACIGQIIFTQNIGMLNIYTAHMSKDIFACAALLAGGASMESAKVRHALLGVILFHTLFIVSPQAGQNMFDNAALGEYFRTFIAYGTIALALVMSRKGGN